MRRHLLILLISSLLFGCITDSRLGAPQNTGELFTESQRLRQLLEDYFEEYLKLAPLFATYIGDHRYDDQQPQHDRKHPPGP